MLLCVFVANKGKFYQSTLIQINYYMQFGVFSTIKAKRFVCF